MIDEGQLLYQPVKNDLRTYKNILKIATSQRDNCTTGYLLDYPYFRKYYKMIAINLSKQQALYADPKAIQRVNFTENLNPAVNAVILFIIEVTQHNTLNVKFSNSQLKKLKSGIKNGIEVVLNPSSNMTGDPNDKINFPHKLLMTDTQVLRLRKVFANNSLANIKL